VVIARAGVPIAQLSHSGQAPASRPPGAMRVRSPWRTNFDRTLDDLFTVLQLRSPLDPWPGCLDTPGASGGSPDHPQLPRLRRLIRDPEKRGSCKPGFLLGTGDQSLPGAAGLLDLAKLERTIRPGLPWLGQSATSNLRPVARDWETSPGIASL